MYLFEKLAINKLPTLFQKQKYYVKKAFAFIRIQTYDLRDFHVTALPTTPHLHVK